MGALGLPTRSIRSYSVLGGAPLLAEVALGLFVHTGDCVCLNLSRVTLVY